MIEIKASVAIIDIKDDIDIDHLANVCMKSLAL